MTTAWILTGLAVLMAACVVLVAAVAAVASILASRRTSDHEPATDTQTLPPAPGAQPVPPARRGHPDLETLRAIVLEGGAR